MCLLAPYAHPFYQNLPCLGDAADAYEAANPFGTMETAIRDVYIKHGVTNEFGLALLHRHFDLHGSEILVEHNGVAVPWKADPASNSYNGLGHLGPRSWAFEGEKARPFEYQFNLDKPIAEPPVDFLTDLARVLHQYGLIHLFGVQVVPGPHQHNMMEFTQGRANITVDTDIEGLPDLVDAMWVFDPVLESEVKCTCTGYCIEGMKTSERGAHTKNHLHSNW